MRPTTKPAMGSKTKTNKVNLKLMKNKNIKMPIILSGSLINPSKAPTTEFSNSAISLEDLLKISPFRCSVK